MGAVVGDGATSSAVTSLDDTAGSGIARLRLPWLAWNHAKVTVPLLVGRQRDARDNTSPASKAVNNIVKTLVMAMLWNSWVDCQI